MWHISMRTVVRLALIMLVAATALSAPKAQAQIIQVVLPTVLTYHDNEGIGRISFTTNATGPVVPIAVTIEQAGAILSGAGTREVVSPTQDAVVFSLRVYVGGAPTGPTYLFSGTLFKDATGKLSGGGTYTLQGAPELVFQWFAHN